MGNVKNESGEKIDWPVFQKRRPHIACTRRINRKHNRPWFKTLGNVKNDGETWSPWFKTVGNVNNESGEKIGWPVVQNRGPTIKSRCHLH